MGSFILVALFASRVQLDISGRFEGIYLLRQGGYRLVLSDDMLLGQEDRLVFALHRSQETGGRRGGYAPVQREPHLQYEWSESDGQGVVRNILSDGTVLLTCLSRFEGEGKGRSRGLFVGGNIPFEEGGDPSERNKNGMAYYDGKRWQHLWNNAAEAIALGARDKAIPASDWEFLGSRVLVSTREKMLFCSSHRVSAEGGTLRVDRFALFRAGEPYFLLVERVRNTGKGASIYSYSYGDEPWIGEHNGSAGNVGWAKGRLYQYEAKLDPARTSYFGMFDHGNGAAGEGNGFSRLANFIETLGERPDLMYFSNRIGSFSEESAMIPLNSPDRRALFMKWGPRYLRPGHYDVYALAIGMAQTEAGSEIPVKPSLAFTERDISDLLVSYGDLR